MTNDGDFYKFLVRLQEFIKEKNRVQFYNASDIQFYIFLYILYQFQKEGIELNSDCLSNWESLDIPKELKAAFYKELKILPTLSEDTIQICSQNNIVHFFYSITFISSCSLQRSESLFWLVHSLLIYSHEDNFADFYGNEFFVEQLSKSAFCESYTCFTASLEDWIFRKIKNQITNKFPKYILKNYDLIEKAINKEVSEDFKFSKIYAFPPFYQKTNEWSKANNVRIVSNTIRGSQDRTEDFVEFIVDSLKDEGQAVVLLSNSIFNRDYADFQKKLIEEKYLTKIINLPQGAVYPNNISASIFVFKKCNNNFGIHFVDLRSFELEVSGSSEIGAFNRIEEKFIKDLLRIKKSAYTAFASYAEIFSNGNNLNSSYYITNTGFKHQAIAGEKFYGEDTENLGYTIRMNNLVVAEYSLSYQKSASQGKDFILAEEAQIFRGFQKVDEKDLHLTADFNSPNYSRLLRITDIEDNRIQDTMPYVIMNNPSLSNFILTDRDLVISKTAVPIKIALGQKGMNIIPAGNYFIIRINMNSRLNKYYLKCYLESEEGEKRLKSLSTGGSLLSFTKGNLLRLKIPFKSEAEQLEIEKEYKALEEKILYAEKMKKDYRKAQLDLLNKL